MGKDSMKNSAKMEQALNTPEGKKLMEVLSKNSSGVLQAAIAEFQKGNMQGAAELLKPIAGSPEVSALVNKMKGK